MKKIIIVLVCLIALPTFARDKETSRKTLAQLTDAVFPFLKQEEEVAIIRRTWAVNDTGPDWVVYVYDEKIGNSLIFVNRKLEVTHKVHCPRKDAPETCKYWDIK